MIMAAAETANITEFVSLLMFRNPDDDVSMNVSQSREMLILITRHNLLHSIF